MNQYELAVLLHPDLEIDIDKPLKKISKLFDEVGAKVVSTDNWGKRKLAYPVGGVNFAIYVFYRLELAGDKVSELEGGLKLADEVLRHLTIRLTDEDLKHIAERQDSKAADKDKIKKAPVSAKGGVRGSDSAKADAGNTKVKPKSTAKSEEKSKT